MYQTMKSIVVVVVANSRRKVGGGGSRWWFGRSCRWWWCLTVGEIMVEVVVVHDGGIVGGEGRERQRREVGDDRLERKALEGRRGSRQERRATQGFLVKVVNEKR
ncbi:hypothetical protein L6452_42037 [Arctium lappa]|uniref:Uncharacterized protein n=1 Tax=Arctium lappa TaxID=4217 RepID=A0ACB8XIB5_ARCLA|nr:hypothetical protein L6452_42037 [Arctium lappa]